MINANQSVSYSEQNLVDCVSIGDTMAGFPSVGLSYYLINGLMKTSSYSSWSNSVKFQNIYIKYLNISIHKVLTFSR
jgi:hypothetical protein